ncbi:TrbI/VirB10 family protein [Sphingobium estronivorans]|uniref:TrbI/VirB10 family protein n=1 Tax=Sphingobium estronivorans TaxID=1577690 RepID=UPI00123B23E0|nr:TrbI/VirB10 family protein [Sphingobium estronivorans]
MPHTNDVLLTVEGAQAAEQRLVKDPLTVSDSEPLRTVPGDDGMVTQNSMHAHGAIYGGIALRNAAAAQERAAADLRAARHSTLLAVEGGKVGTAGYAEATLGQADGAAPASASSVPDIDPERDPNRQVSKARFVTAKGDTSDVNSHALVPPASPNILSAGSVISASLITGLRSDLPGLVTAQVTERVYDSATGRALLIPQGARLIGQYDSVIAYGQSRALVVWQRIIMPDGSSIRIDNAPATDPSGYAGLSDKVDFHTWRLLQGVAVSTLLGVGANLSFSDKSDLVQVIREATQQNVARAGDQITARNLQVQPTITVRPGAPVRLLIHRDLVLPPWKG